MEGREYAGFHSNQRLHQVISLISPSSLVEGVVISEITSRPSMAHDCPPLHYTITHLSPPLAVMDGWVSDLTSSLSSVFNQEDVIQRVVEEIKNLGVCSAEDLKYVDAADLQGVLKAIEIRKFMAWIKRK